MDALLAGRLLRALGVYAALGTSFALPFLLWGVARIDPAARGATLGFRIAILPGVVMLWPWLAWRWLSGSREPPAQIDAWRRAARSAP